MRAVLIVGCLLALSIVPAASAQLGLVPPPADRPFDRLPIAAPPIPELPAQSPVTPEIPDPTITLFRPEQAEGSVHADAQRVGPALFVVTPPAPEVSPAGGTLAAVVIAMVAWASTKIPLGTGWGRRIARLALAYPLALFSRIESARLLDSPVRQGMVSHVQDNPGASLREAQRAAGVAWGTAVYHLRRLEKDGLIVSLREGAHRRYWVCNTPEASRRATTARLLGPSARALAQAILARPGSHQAELAAAAGLSTATASRQLRRFELAGLAIIVRQGHARTVQPGGTLAALLADAGAAPILVTMDPATVSSASVTLTPAQ